MISYTLYRNRFGTLTKNSTVTNLSLGDQLIAESLRYLTGKFYMNERSYTTKTVSGQQFYALPPQVKKLIDLTVTVGGVLWTTKPAPNREYWDSLNVIEFQQNYPSFHFVYNGNQVGVWPTPASSGDIITMNYQIRLRDLSQPDYVAGSVSLPYTRTLTIAPASGDTSATMTIAWPLVTDIYQIVFSNGETRKVTLTNGSAAITWSDALSSAATTTITVNEEMGGSIVIGAGTTFIPDMATGQRWLQVTAPTGDNQWYQIGGFISSTAITLLNPYTGNSVTGGSYTIGEMPILPEDYQDLALYRSLWIYFTSIVPDSGRSKLYKDLYDDGYIMLNQEYGQKNTSPVLMDTDASVYNPNLFVRSVSG